MCVSVRQKGGKYSSHFRIQFRKPKPSTGKATEQAWKWGVVVLRTGFISFLDTWASTVLLLLLLFTSAFPLMGSFHFLLSSTALLGGLRKGGGKQHKDAFYAANDLAV